jgi:Fe2+ transport system protein FeoA
MADRTLNLLRNGESAAVTQVLVQGKIKRRLVEMGITPGTNVTVTKRAPLGDPIEIQLRGYKLTIRREDAEGIRVTGGASA